MGGSGHHCYGVRCCASGITGNHAAGICPLALELNYLKGRIAGCAPCHPLAVLQAYAIAAHSLASMAICCASHGGRWGYDQVQPRRQPCFLCSYRFMPALMRCTALMICLLLHPALLSLILYLYCPRTASVPQVVDLLLKLYKFPNFSVSRALLHGTTAPTPATAAPGAATKLGSDVPIGGCAA